MQPVQTNEPRSTRSVPGPRAWPVIGNTGVFRGLIPFLEQQFRAHGDVFRMRTPAMNAVVMANPDHLQHVLLTHRKNYVKGDVYDHVRGVIGHDNLVTLEGESWRTRRTLAQPAFHRRSLQDLARVMVETGARYFEGLSARLGGEPATLDVHREMTRITMDVVVAALFGQGGFDGTRLSYETMSDALEVLSAGVNGVPLPSWLPTPGNLKFRRTLRDLNAGVHEVIRAARERGVDGSTLLGMLLDARGEDDVPLSDATLRDEVLTLFVAGHETTALTLTWVFALLSDHPEVLAQMVEEVDQVLGGRDPGFEDVPKLVYLRQVVDETLRLRPPAPMVGRNALADDTVGGFEVRAGDVVLPCIWGAHRHPDHWQQPDRFDPERFAPGRSERRHPGAYLPFIIGPRICIGNTFALTESVLLLAQMLLRYELSIEPGQDVQPVAVGTVRPSRPVRVRFRMR